MNIHAPTAPAASPRATGRLRRCAGLAAAALAVAFTTPVPTAQAAPAGEAHLPDLWAYYPYTLQLEHAMPRTYSECSADRPQGISVGWADIYPWDLPGQGLDISRVPDGTYWLMVTADPANLIAEGENPEAEINNTNGTKLRLSNRGRRVSVIRYGL